MARRSGVNVAIEISPDGGTNWQSLGCIESYNISRKRERFKATCGGDLNHRYTVGKPDYTGSSAYIWDDADDGIFDAANETDPVLLRLYPDKVNAPTKYDQGEFYLDMTMTVGNDTIKGTIELIAAGDVVWH